MAGRSSSATAARVHEMVQAEQAAMVRVRRHLHAHPEPSFEEVATGAFIASELRRVGVEPRTGIAGTGVIGVLRGKPGDRVVCLRADMDALPIQETGTAAYRSTVPGWMHACGHDAHTAMVLGAGLVLQALREEWAGTVLLLFQPGEEKNPGGASLVLKEKALDDPRPHAILGQHVTPELALGKVGFHAGPFMASSDELYVTVKGKGGHAAMPANLIDPILIAARLLLGLKEAFEGLRQGRPAVLAFGRVVADGATNVVPDTVRIAGTLRTFDEGFRNELHEWLPRWSNDFCKALGGGCDFEVQRGYPVVVNEAALTSRVHAAAVDYLGAERVVEMPQRMGSEDFGFYTEVMPGCFFRLGTGDADRGFTTGLHTPAFDIPEEALAIGAGVMVWAALKELR